jgi:hypothetical protein
LGGCLLRVVFFKITEVAHIYGLCPIVCVYIHIYIQKRVGLNFGRLFHKLIWSPWTWCSLEKILIRRKLIELVFRYICSEIIWNNPGVDSTIGSYNACAVNIYNAMSA